VIPIGDEYFIKDLSLVLRTSWKEAALILDKYGLADPELADEHLAIDVGNIQGKESKPVSQKVIAEIISARLLEIMEIVLAELNTRGLKDRIPAGIVLTGGGASLSGIIELLARNMDIPVRLGVPDNVSHVSADFIQPINANVLGGLQYISKNYDTKQLEIKGITKIWDDITYWVKDLFR
jgi:cell division protein FtsA